MVAFSIRIWLGSGLPAEFIAHFVELIAEMALDPLTLYLSCGDKIVQAFDLIGVYGWADCWLGHGINENSGIRVNNGF